MHMKLEWAEIVVRAIARNYALNRGEHAQLRAGIDLYDRYADTDTHTPIPDAVARVVEAVRGGRPTGLGHQYVRRLPVHGRYVVFSDHHMVHDGHRHDLFNTRNAALYADVLHHYDGEEWVLVENGDVEELIIFDPVHHPQFPGAGDPGDEMRLRSALTLAELTERRRICRSIQLGAILDSQSIQPVIAAQRAFKDHGRWIRISGNHDYDVQEAAWAPFHRCYQIDEKPLDYLLLTEDPADRTSRVHYVVMHGHQFDAHSAPGAAPTRGEVYSEALGVFFQGCDRTWTADDCARWFNHPEGFPNVLAASLPATRALAEMQEHLQRIGSRTAPARLISAAAEDESLGGLIESLFKSPIAWDYFKHRDHTLALADEVIPGWEWVKLRHTDETTIDTHLAHAFAGAPWRPTLVLGHTHEPRLNAAYPTEDGEASHYLNSGSAGRFDQHLWAIELVDGEHRLVSWVPGANGAPKCVEWEPRRVNGVAGLHPRD